MDNLKVTLGLIPDNCEEPYAVEIKNMSITYSQPADSMSDPDEYQYLTISAQNASCSEDGWYLNISTKDCDHWSINSPEEFLQILNDFKSRMNLNITKSEDLKVFER